MQALPSVLRGLLLAAAFAQSALPAVLVAADEVRRRDYPVAPSHVDAPGTSHDYRAHEHDCVACQLLRTPAVLIRQTAPHLTSSEVAQRPAASRAVVARERTYDASARAPPVERI